MKDQVPVIVSAAGLGVNEKVEMVPFDDTEQGVARIPVARSMVDGAHPGETPVPCKYRELAADSTTGTPAEAHASAATASPMAPTAIHPIRRLAGDWRAGTARIGAVGDPVGRPPTRGASPTAARWPRSQRRSSCSRRRW